MFEVMACLTTHWILKAAYKCVKYHILPLKIKRIVIFMKEYHK